MAYNWAKVYIEILDDPKMGVLPDNLWRRVIELILIAKRFDRGGLLPGILEIAWTLHTSVEVVEADLAQIAKSGIVEQRADGWFLPKFAKRQAPDPVVERVRNFRERQVKQDGNDNVTESYQTRLDETRQDSDKTTGAQNAPEPKKLTTLQQAQATLENEFSTITAIPLPNRKTDKEKKSAAAGWWHPLTEIWELENKDVEKAKRLIRLSVDKLRVGGMTVADPRSILKTAISIHGNGKSQHAEQPRKVYQ